MKVEVAEEVIFCDTDCGGVVSNVAYLRYVEKARCHLFEALGMPLREMPQSGLFPAVVRTEIDYRKPARLGDRLIVEAAGRVVDQLRIECHFQILRAPDLTGSKDAQNEELLVEALQVVVLVQMPEGRPVRIPEELKKSCGI